MSPQTSQTQQTRQDTVAEAAAEFGATVASVLQAAGGNARTVEELDSLVEVRSASRLLRDLRARLVDTGVPGLLVPESADGLGLLEEGGAVAALVAVARAAGGVPGPDIAGPWAVAPIVLRLAQADTALQSAVAAGTERLAVLDLTQPATDALRVVDGEEASGLLVLEPGRIRLVRDAALLPVASFDPTRPVSTVARESLTGGDELIQGPQADRISAIARAAGRLVLAAELHGTGEELLRLVVEHLRTRMAFGRPLGSFQALKHRTADLWSELSLVCSLVDEAADRLDAALEQAASDSAADAGELDPEFSAYAAAALSLASDTVVHGGEEVLQLHGGIGYTWESPVHVLLKRAVATRVRWGTPSALRREVAAHVDL